jgi:hypothetical protein
MGNLVCFRKQSTIYVAESVDDLAGEAEYCFRH